MISGMAYKTILTNAAAGRNAEPRISLALSLGRLFDGVTLGVGPDETAFLGLADKAHASTVWATESGPSLPAMVARARCADLIVAGPPGEGDEEPDPAGLIFETGAPVLLVPDDMDCLYPRTVMIGWKNTAATRRAIADALAFLRVAERTVLVGLDEDGAAPSRPEMEAVAQRLRRHGLRCDLLTPSRIGRSVADELVGMAGSVGAELLVAGAFARSPWREGLFGGVTRDLLSGPSMPVLFSR
jgi:nucleotide-binding universal stress UspA family protein